MAKFRRSICLSLVTLCLVTCAKTPQNPYENPANAKITADHSLSNVKDSLLIGNSYQCSVAVFLPSLVDTLVIRVTGNGKDSVIQKIASKGVTPIIFSYAPADTGSFAMQAVIIKTDKTKDSLAQPKQFRIVAPIRCAILSFKPSKDSLLIEAAAYQCTVLIAHPSLSDSFAVRCVKSNKESLLAHGTLIPAIASDTGIIVFPLEISAPGTYGIRVFVFKSNVVKDSLIKTIFGYSIPIVTPLQGAYHAVFGDSLLVRFLVTTVDSNLYGYSTFLSLDADTTKSHRVDVMYSITSRLGSDTITRVLRRPMLREGLSAPLVCYAQAVTRNYAFSTVASCSVYVADTTHPKLTLLAPVNPVDSIVKLPDSIIVKAIDAWAVDSVTINGVKMLLKNDSLGQYLSVFSTLPQGVTFDTIIAWDKARNSDTVVMTLKYGGPPTYPPKIKNLNRIVREGRVFDTLFLDTCITVTDPSADSAYRKGLTWTITDSVGNTVLYSTTARKLFVPVKADSEWVDTFNLNFKVIAPGGLSDSRVGTFMVYEVPDPPKITLDSLHLKYVGTPFDTLFLDTCASDPDNASSTLIWAFKNGKFFHVDSIMSAFITIPHSSQIIIRPRFFTRKIVIAPDTTKINPATWTGNDTLTFTVTDPTALSRSKRMIFSKWKLKPIHAGEDQTVWERKNE